MAGAGTWCLPALYFPVSFPSLIGHKASSALVYLRLSPQDFPAAPWALQSSAVISKGSSSVIRVSEGTALTVGSQSNVKAAQEHPREGGRCPGKGSLSAEDEVWAQWAERRAAVQVGAPKEVTCPWTEMWHQPSLSLTAIKQSTGSRKPAEASHQHPCPLSFLRSLNLVSRKMKAVHSTCILQLDF